MICKSRKNITNNWKPLKSEKGLAPHLYQSMQLKYLNCKSSLLTVMKKMIRSKIHRKSYRAWGKRNYIRRTEEASSGNFSPSLQQNMHILQNPKLQIQKCKYSQRVCMYHLTSTEKQKAGGKRQHEAYEQEDENV